MSIASEITRLQGAKADLKTAIEGKGVTVPAAALLDDYADLVDAIQTGGGSGNTDDDWMNKVVTSITTTITDHKLSLDGFSELITFSAPNLINMFNANFFFRNCTKLTSISLPALERMYGSNMFENTKITTLVLPNIGDGANSARTQSIIGGNCFKGCTNLQSLDFARVNRIDGNAFLNSTGFETFIIRGGAGVGLDEIPQLQNINAFDSTPFASDGTGGTLYVPESYISTYENDTNWSTILSYTNNQIKKIEGSQYENYYADGTPIT